MVDDGLEWTPVCCYRGVPGSLVFVTPRSGTYRLRGVRCKVIERNDCYDRNKYRRAEWNIRFTLAEAQYYGNTVWSHVFYNARPPIVAKPITERRGEYFYYMFGLRFLHERLKAGAGYWLHWYWVTGERQGDCDGAPMEVGLEKVRMRVPANKT